MHHPRVENGVVVGTGSDKYQTKNPIARYALNQLLETVVAFVGSANPSTILEVGCGEGNITELLLRHTHASIHATDVSLALANEAKSRIGEHARLQFSELNIYDLEGSRYASEVVVCCEVLEHLEHPDEGLRRIAKATKGLAVLSVPREPNFRLLNFFRGQHFTALGNAPGHVQHWSKPAFVKFVQTEFDVLRVKALLPWTVVLARPRLAS